MLATLNGSSNVWWNNTFKGIPMGGLSHGKALMVIDFGVAKHTLQI